MSTSELHLFDALDPEHARDLERLFVPRTFADGEALFHQGDAASWACVLDEGALRLSVRLPGGGQAPLTRLTPGAVLGELALIRDSTRSATARAVGEVRVRAMERRGFQSLLALRHPLSFILLERIARLTAARIAGTNARIIQLLGEPRAAQTPPDASDWRLDARPGADFPIRDFLPALSFFATFSPAEIDAFHALCVPWTLRPGATLFHQGARANACLLVVRGAVSALIGPGDAHRVGVLGPGALFGTLGALLHRPRTATCRVREHATLLELPEATLRNLLSGPDASPAAFPTLTALTHALLGRLTHTNRSLARLEQGQLTAACDLIPRRR